MPSETLVADEVALSPRASIALLTLQLRAALHEADVAEAEEAGWDVDAALAQLRARLEPLVEDRRRALEVLISRLRTDSVVAMPNVAELATTVAECSPAVVGAFVVDDEFVDEIALVVADDELPCAEMRGTGELLLVDHEVTCVDELAIAEALGDDELPLVADGIPSPAADTSPWARPMPGDVVSTMPVDVLPLIVEEVAEQDPGAPNHREPSSTTVVIDADSFSQAFAAAFAVAFAAILDERASAFGTGMPLGAVWRVAPPPVAARKSFWASAWHADFLLSMIAMIIVLVVFIAWSA